MYRYNRLLVALNFLEHEDQATLQYASMICRVVQPASILFVHIAETLDLPKDLLREKGPLAISLQERLKERVDTYFDAPEETVVRLEIGEGAPLVELLHKASQNDIDLIIVGSRHKTQGGGKIPERLSRKAPCSVLIVPENAKPEIQKVLLATDFSSHSGNALEVAVDFAKAVKLSEIVCLHLYPVPLGYYKIGKTFEEFDELMRKHAKERYKAFISGKDLKGLHMRPIFLHHEKPGYGIIDAARNEQADLVVIGTQGRTASAAMLLGSVAERVIVNTETPLVAVKKKGEEANMKFLQAFLKI